MKAAKIPAGRKVDEETLTGLRCPSHRLCCSPSKIQAGEKRRGVFTVTKSFNVSCGCSDCVSVTTVRPSTKLFSIRSLEAWNFLPVSRAFAIFGIKDPRQCVKRKRGNTAETYESRIRTSFSICSQKQQKVRSLVSEKKSKKKKAGEREPQPHGCRFSSTHLQCRGWRDKHRWKLSNTSQLDRSPEQTHNVTFLWVISQRKSKRSYCILQRSKYRKSF